jgi:hypothetical protein
MIEARCTTCGWGRRQAPQGGDGPPDAVAAHLSLYPSHQMTWGRPDPRSEAAPLEPLGEHELALASAYRAGWDAAVRHHRGRLEKVVRGLMEGLA